MDATIDEYIVNVKSHLVCNSSEEDKKVYYLYDYTNEQIDSNIKYFRKCLNQNLSGYKALLYFFDYLKEQQ